MTVLMNGPNLLSFGSIPMLEFSATLVEDVGQLLMLDHHDKSWECSVASTEDWAIRS